MSFLPFKRSRVSLLERVTIILFLAGILLSVTHTIWSFDVWWHLKTGEWILTHKTVPELDPYSYTVPGYPWIDLSWFFQLLLYSSYKALGFYGVIFFKITIVTSTFFLLFRFFYKKLDLALLLFLLTLSLYAAHERLVERPEVTSYFFLVVYLILLERGRRKPSKGLYLLPLIHILWVNTHALFILGLLALASTVLGETFSWFVSRGRKEASFPWRLYLVSLVILLATLVNPYGLKGALFPHVLYTRISGELEIFTEGIGEFTRPLSEYDPTFTVLLFKALLGMGLLSFLLNHRRFPPAHGLLFLAFTYLALLARRNIAPFSFVSCFVILSNLKGFFEEKPSLRNRIKLPLPFLLAFTLLFPLPFMTGTFYEHEKLGKRFGLGVSKHRYAIGVAEFIDSVGLEGNLFNANLDVGNYFIWHFYPRRKVFLDGRLEVYGASFYEGVFRYFGPPSRFPRLAEKYQVNFCVLSHISSMRSDDFLVWFHRSPDWVPVYLDELMILFVKNAPQNKEIIAQYAIPLKEDLPQPEDDFPLVTKRSFFTPLLDHYIPFIQKADLYAKFSLLKRAEAIYRKVVIALPRTATVHYNLAVILRRQEKLKEAFKEYEEAIRLEPKNFLFRYSLGGFYFDLGLEDLAFQEFKKSARLAPHFGEAHYKLGRLYAKRGLKHLAEREYRSVKRLDTAYLSARNALGILYTQQGEWEKAEKEFKTVLKVSPDASGTLANLKKLKKEMKK